MRTASELFLFVPAVVWRGGGDSVVEVPDDDDVTAGRCRCMYAMLLLTGDVIFNILQMLCIPRRSLAVEIRYFAYTWTPHGALHIAGETPLYEG